MPDDLRPDEMRRITRAVRQVNGLTQMQLARRARIDQSKLSLYESGLVDLRPKELQRVKKVVDSLPRNPKVPFSKLLLAADPELVIDKQLLTNESGKLLRQEARLSQRALALRTGIPRNKISLWEIGKAEVELTAEEKLKFMDVCHEAIGRPSSIRAFEAVYSGQPIPSDILAFERAYAANFGAGGFLEAVKHVHLKKVEEKKSQLARLENLSGVDDPIVGEIMESLRREIAGLERQLADSQYTELHEAPLYVQRMWNALMGYRRLLEILRPSPTDFEAALATLPERQREGIGALAEAIKS